MKDFLFRATCQIIVIHIAVVHGLAENLVGLSGRAGNFWMSLIDSQKLAIYEKILEAQADQSDEQHTVELGLLASAYKIRDHAQATGDWTEGHTDAINAVGEALVVESGWAEEATHTYLRSIVESIDGLQYGGD